jgi:IS30 family transposase
MPDLTKRNKHLTLDDRIEIQECLTHGMTFKATAARIGKDPTTVSKEVKKHLIIAPTAVKHYSKNGLPIASPVCAQLLKAPFVCNGCAKKNVRCAFDKRHYNAKQAQKEYEALLSESREGIPLNHEEFYEIDNVVSSGIKRGQHLYHILQTNDLGVSKSTVYRHLNRGYLSVSPIDFPRVVKFKARRQRRGEYIPKAAKIGRTHLDFLNHIEQNGIPSWVEMDTVIGRVGGKVILTLDFTFCNFMVGILLADKTSSEVAARITRLKKQLATIDVHFGDIFPLILCDNGGEFADISAIENDLNGLVETKLFFCDPMQSSQKPFVEKNHTLFRDIVPKGKSFDNFTQDTVDLIFSHVNCVKRKIFNGKSPFELFSFTFGEHIADIFGIVPIPADCVLQSPKLLRSINF